MTPAIASVADTISNEIRSLNEQIAQHEAQAIALREKVLGFEISSCREQLFPTRASTFMSRTYSHPGPDFEHVRGFEPHLSRVRAAKAEWETRVSNLLSNVSP